MKKNSTMRVAALLLALTLMTSCFVGGTFAKYTTAGESSDSARVAVWGVQVSAEFENLFKSEYATTDAWTGDDGVSVKSRLGGDVLAPGTDGTLANFIVSGQPEVDVEVTYEATLTIDGDWLADTDNDGNVDDEYCPLVINVNGTPYYINASDITTVAALKSAVEGAINTYTNRYDAGTDLSDVGDDLAVTWTWAFENGIPCQNDTDDTDLGNWQLNGKTMPSISLEIECTITQVD